MNDLAVRFKGFDFILVREDVTQAGALTTREIALRGEISFAHLFESGKIKCFDRVIGSYNDLEVLGETPPIRVGHPVFSKDWTRAAWNRVWADRKHIIEEASGNAGPGIGATN
jgi:hypothetical protein